jgi:DNA modification methylase
MNCIPRLNAYQGRRHVGKAKILVGDVRTRMSEIKDGSVQCVVTSPPYWGLRDYGHDGQIGLEQTPIDYVAEMVTVFREVWRVLADDGVLWLNLGDSYAGSGKGPAGNLGKNHNERHMEHKHSAIVPEGLKPKDLVGIPWRVAFALQADGWYLRQDIIWAKPNPMPESVTDRCTKSHEYVFMLTKQPKYYFNDKAIAEPAKTKPGATWQERKAAGATAGNVIVGDGTRNGTQRVVHGKGVTSNLTRQDGMRNKRDVWTIPTKPFKGAHFAVMPEAIVEPCVLASSRLGDTVFDPFTGSGTVGVVALRHGRNFMGTELSPQYAEIALNRINGQNPLINDVILEKVTSNE